LITTMSSTLGYMAKGQRRSEQLSIAAFLSRRDRVHRQREVMITRYQEDEACPKLSYVIKLDVTNVSFCAGRCGA